MQLTRLDQALWTATFVEDLILVSVLVFRGRRRGLGAFTALIGLDIVRTLVLLALQRYGSRAEYFYTYWSLALIDMALQIAVLFTIATQVFRSSGKWAKDTVGSALSF